MTTPPSAQPLWHGRFSSAPSDDLLAFTESLSFDVRLWRDDIDGSLAHVRGLGRSGILAPSEVSAICAALDQVADEFASGAFSFVAGEEDVHTAIERRVTEICGPVGGKLHTGRSRNDQCVTALRLWCRRELRVIANELLELCDTLRSRAHSAGWGADAVYLPGYTHVQRAQPVLLAHHFMAHGWAFMRDVERLAQTVRRLDVSTLGAGALAGSSLPLEPTSVAEDLGFGSTFTNSLDAVSDRDFVAEALFDLALVGSHLSRLGEEWVLWTTEEFGFATLSDGYSTGSSMLPQKKNADIAELARGKAGRLLGNLAGFLATLKGLPLAYNRDLQEDKEPLFDSVDQTRRAIVAMRGMIATATIRAEKMRAAADSEVLAATDLAEWLVGEGMPFREAHAVVGGLVQRVVAGEGTLFDLASKHPQLGERAAGMIARGVRNRTSPGGAGPEPVARQYEQYCAQMNLLRASSDL